MHITWLLPRPEDGNFRKFPATAIVNKRDFGDTVYKIDVATPHHVEYLKNKGFTIVTDRNVMAQGNAFLDTSKSEPASGVLGCLYAYKIDLETKLNGEATRQLDLDIVARGAPLGMTTS